MSSFQKKIIILFILVLFLSVLYTYNNQIAGGSLFMACLYMVLSSGTILSLVYVLAKLLNIRFYKLLLLSIFIEVFTELYTIYILPDTYTRVSKITRFPKLRDYTMSFLNYTKDIAFEVSSQGVVQYYRDIAQYNDKLFYLFKPDAESYFSGSKEYKVRYKINSFGLRDDELSARNPEIIFIGDSHTLGYGVNYEEAYPKIVGNNLRIRTLNAGVSSYGTSRELSLFKKLPVDSCKILVIQYCLNDIDENKAFIKNNFEYKAPPITMYNSLANITFVSRYYYPFKNIHSVINAHLLKLRIWLSSITAKKTSENEIKSSIEKDSEDFFKILKNLRGDFKGKIIVHIMDFDRGQSQKYYESFKEYLSANNEKNDIYLFNSLKSLEECSDCNLFYDVHNNAKGYKIIGDSLSRFITENKLLQ